MFKEYHVVFMIEWIVSGHMVSFSLACRRESKVLANKKASVGLALPAAGPGGSDISRSSWHTFLGKKG
jgi:hypothetical protein